MTGRSSSLSRLLTGLLLPGALLLVFTGCSVTQSSNSRGSSGLLAPKNAFRGSSGNYATRFSGGGTQANLSRTTSGPKDWVRPQGLGGPEALSAPLGEPELDTKVFIARSPIGPSGSVGGAGGFNTIEFNTEPGWYYTILVRTKGEPGGWNILPGTLNVRGDGRTRSFTDRHPGHMVRKYHPHVTKKPVKPNQGSGNRRVSSGSSWGRG